MSKLFHVVTIVNDVVTICHNARPLPQGAADRLVLKLAAEGILAETREVFPMRNWTVTAYAALKPGGPQEEQFMALVSADEPTLESPLFAGWFDVEDFEAIAE